jgi:two-component system, NarL family, nitrate/nitrite response regulator NarL
VPLRPQEQSHPIRVALRIADRTLRARISRACAAAGIAVANPGEAADGADIVLADRPIALQAPVIVLSSRAVSRRDDVSAVVPPDIDGRTLAHVIAVVAAGLAVTPRADAAGALDTDELPVAEPRWADALDRGAGDDAASALTPREREVLALLAAGASNKAIARALSVSVHTAKFHVASVCEKLGASGRLEAVAIALRSGLVMV